MKAIRDNIIGRKIECVYYGEVNIHDGPFYFSNFDVVDSGVNFVMDNGYKWHLNFKSLDVFAFAEEFRLGEGEFFFIDESVKEITKIWDATERWQAFLNLEIVDFSVDFVDAESTVPQRCKIHFENGAIITLLIAEEQNLDHSIPDPLNFIDVNELYIFFDDNVPKFEPVTYVPYSIKDVENEQLKKTTEMLSTSKVIWAFVIFLILVLSIYLSSISAWRSYQILHN